MKEITTWFWVQHIQQQVIIATTKKNHPQLYVTAIKCIHDITKSVCNRTQAKKYISRHPIFLTDSDYD